MQGFVYVQNSMIYALYSFCYVRVVVLSNEKPIPFGRCKNRPPNTHSVPSMVLLSKKSKYSGSRGSREWVRVLDNTVKSRSRWKSLGRQSGELWVHPKKKEANEQTNKQRTARLVAKRTRNR
jgi:hypothetical protein